jgi:hypothetical protein
MRLPSLAFACVAVLEMALGSAGAAEPIRDKLPASCVDATALVFGPVERDATPPLAGALVLDWDKRLLLTHSTGVPDTPSVVFPAYSDTWDLLTDPANYLTLWKQAERWGGEVLHRDKNRDLAVLRLDRGLPWRAEPAAFARKAPAEGTAAYALADGKTTSGVARHFAIADGKVLAADKAGGNKGRTVTASVPAGSGLTCGLFDAAGLVVGVGAAPGPRIDTSAWLDVSEVRAFLVEKKVPFRPTDEEVPLRLTLAAKTKTVKAGEKPVFLLKIENQGTTPERLLNGAKSKLQRVWFSLSIWRDGKPVPRNAFLVGVPFMEPDDYLTLKPGEKVEFEMARFDISLSNLPPGEYQARLQFHTWPEEGTGVRLLTPRADFRVEK